MSEQVRLVGLDELQKLRRDNATLLAAAQEVCDAFRDMIYQPETRKHKAIAGLKIAVQSAKTPAEPEASRREAGSGSGPRCPDCEGLNTGPRKAIDFVCGDCGAIFDETESQYGD